MTEYERLVDAFEVAVRWYDDVIDAVVEAQPGSRDEVDGVGKIRAARADMGAVRAALLTYVAKLEASRPVDVTPEMVEAAVRIVSGCGDQFYDGDWDAPPVNERDELERGEWLEFTQRILAAALAARPTTEGVPDA